MSIRRYHEQTKHHLNAYAPGPGALDWANQPDPFRRYAGAPRVALALTARGLTTLFNSVRSARPVPSQARRIRSIGALFEISLGPSAWKVYQGSSWALRCNPSSGNLHPTEGYLVCPRVGDLGPGVYHYASREHALERRAVMEWGSAFPEGGLIVGLSAIVWREAGKYGARAYRYCQHDAGHAIAAIRYASAVLGWRAKVLEAPGDHAVSRLLGLDREEDLAGAEPERPEALLWVGPADAKPDCEALAACPGLWLGRANRLSPGHVHWPQIEMAERACVKPGTAPGPRGRAAAPPLKHLGNAVEAVRIITQRRSAMAFDGRTYVSHETFFKLLDATLPRGDVPPWDAVPWGPRVHLVLFVPRVRDLAAGLYLLLVRRDALVPELRQALGQDWRWEPVPDAPGHVALHLLLPADTKEAARTLPRLPPGHRRRLRVFPGDAGRVRGHPGGRRVALSGAVLGGRRHRPGALPGGRGGGSAWDRHRLLFRRHRP